MPNFDGSVEETAKTEEELLLGELAYSPLFRTFLEQVVAPRITFMRSKLLRQQYLPENERAGFVAFLDEFEKMLIEVYTHTEAGVVPAWLAALFR
jgi:hypothetical protein